ncbi:hypothetical protein LTR91_021947 [Friedmanniomyces endolithicus]|uniref:Trafficking protein particle complex subunit n=1 Tax=Friedmanniomyces endolithicus TaxID=329885 RepID=A0AAN6J143_9PEZI|nr:hypothetical protein LTR35_016194 [Friedmanniomyces endolithicus]KAK0297814.1 hypothetical protein LTS00_003352 [Friedmanniomyces endolithicus]KAK0306204.1 hypothetical protein LTR82_016502 [Friedmanniomyces endolithicus]KAK0904452.1 hypothetical protein LTR57_018704 [Friedmanniomyces endolithicus]KAK0957305.1 hypothetical protein LTR91_021947 [Friedmanniomyces endolithicus]
MGRGTWGCRYELHSLLSLTLTQHPALLARQPSPTTNMVVFALLIINKAGGLIYTRTFAPGIQKLDSNDYLILAGTFHGIHAISRSINPAPPPPPSSSSTPNPSSSTTASQPAPQLPSQPPSSTAGNPTRRRPHTTGIESLESSHFRLTCFQSPTGVKFLLFTSPEQPNTDVVVRRCYEMYGNYVMKNPFYSLEMPIRVEKFDRVVAGYLVRP